MSTQIKGRKVATRTRNYFVPGMFALLLVGVAVVGPAIADDTTEKRTTVNSHHASGGRESAAPSSVTNDEFAPLKLTGEREKAQTRGGFAKPGAESAKSASNDFWFYEADVILFGDDDNDGYSYGIDLMFDADTIYADAEVYAVLYLSYEGGPWNEYAATEDFTIFGASSDDNYVLVSELMSGYPTGSYDLLIELFDAWDGTFLASFGPEDTSALGFLPLEDFDRDEPIQDVIVVTQGGGGGGSADGWTILVLLLLLVAGAARKIWRHRHDALIRIDAEAPVWQLAENRRNSPIH